MQDKVAKVGGVSLLRSDTDKILPKGISKEDSVALVGKYINSWAIKQLMVLKAKEELPSDDLDVDKELEEYKMQLLAYRYENRYVEQRLDTLVTEQQLEDYYNEHIESFISKNGLIKGRLIKTLNNSPNLQIIRKLAKIRDLESADELEQVATSSAYIYKNYNNEWVDLHLVSREIGIELQDIQSKIRREGFFETKDSVYTTIVQCLEYISEGDTPPFEYYKDKIKDIIISRRKQDLIATLQKDILNEALNNNKLKIINNESN